MTGGPVSTNRLLLRAALLQVDAVAPAWTAWRQVVDLDRLDPASSALLPLLGRNLERHGVQTPDQRFFRWLQHAAWAANTRRLTDAVALVDQLQAAGHEVVLLKGAALVASGAYPDPGLRPMADVDLLVRPDAVPAIMGQLREAGWRPFGWAPFCDAPERTIPVRHSHGFAHPSGAEIDLHWHVLWESCAPGADAAFWSSTSAATLYGRHVRTLDATHQLLQVCVHGARWESPSTRRWVADAMHILRHAPPVDWDRLTSVAERHGVTIALRGALAYLADLLDAPVPAGVRARLARVRTGAAERLQYRLQMSPPGRLGGLPLLAVHQWRLARATGGWPFVGLPGYLWRMYELQHVRQLRDALAHGLRPRARGSTSPARSAYDH